MVTVDKSPSLTMSAVSSSVRAHCVAHSDNFDHDYWLELPVKESEVPNHYAGDLLHALAISAGAFPRANAANRHGGGQYSLRWGYTRNEESTLPRG